MSNKKKFALVFVGMILIGSIISGCATPVPLENTVKLEFGGTLPPEVLSYFDANQLKDIEAKFIVVQGRAEESDATSVLSDSLFGKKVVQVAMLITVGKDYRIVQMSKYIKPYYDSNNRLIPGEHRRLDRIDIVPNMATKYNTLQEAQLASEMGA
jgi:hypothetical protein